MRVSDLLEHLREQEVRLTLPNIASITEQQLGGFLCHGVHGSGVGFGSFDELMEKMWVAVPRGESGEMDHLFTSVLLSSLTRRTTSQRNTLSQFQNSCLFTCIYIYNEQGSFVLLYFSR